MKKKLEEYIDACKLAEDLERDLREFKRIVGEFKADKVKGSMCDFPYTEVTYSVEGSSYKKADLELIYREQARKAERLRRCRKLKAEVEEYMQNIPMRMQRIINYRIFDKLPWNAVADKMGGSATGESVRKECSRFFK